MEPFPSPSPRDAQKSTPESRVDRERLRLAVEGDHDRVRVPLPFQDRAQLQRFVNELATTFLSEAIRDASVKQVGPGTTGWSGNARRYQEFLARGGTNDGWFHYGAWKPGSNTEFVVFSDEALVQAKDVMEHNPQIDREHRLFKNGENPSQVNSAGRPGFANAPLGAKLLALALKWNQEIYGTPNPATGGFNFVLNLDINLHRYSAALEVYRGPGAEAREKRRSVES